MRYAWLSVCYGGCAPLLLRRSGLRITAPCPQCGTSISSHRHVHMRAHSSTRTPHTHLTRHTRTQRHSEPRTSPQVRFGTLEGPFALRSLLTAARRGKHRHHSHARRAALSHTRVRLCTRMHASATAWACCAPRRRRAPLQSGAHMLAGAAIAPRLRHAAARRDEWCSPAQCHSRRWSCGRRAACRQR